MKQLTHLAGRFIGVPLAIHPPKLEVIIKAIGPRLGIDAQRIPHSEAPAVFAETYNSAGEDSPDYQVVDEIAIIAVSGVLLKRQTALSAWSGVSSYQGIQSQVAAAVDDANVQAILLDIDSPGGETNGCFDLSDYIYSVRRAKPIYAVANDIALSAAYAIASAASKIYVTRTGAVGSVGVYALHAEQSGFDKALGVKYTYIHHGDKKVDGNPHEPLSDGATADIQAEVDRQSKIFVDTVARNRGVGAGRIQATEAGLLWGGNAIPLFADEEGTAEDALNALRSVISVFTHEGDGAKMGNASPARPQSATTGVREIRGNARAEERELNMITPRTNTSTEAAVMRQLETEAKALALRSQGTVTSGLYAPSERRGMTKEQAMARTLEDNPESYEVFRKAHNAAPVLRALRDAGIELGG